MAHAQLKTAVSIASINSTIIAIYSAENCHHKRKQRRQRRGPTSMRDAAFDLTLVKRPQLRLVAASTRQYRTSEIAEIAGGESGDNGDSGGSVCRMYAERAEGESGDRGDRGGDGVGRWQREVAEMSVGDSGDGHSG
eukprot:2279731-Rhodomonas_salina.2